MDTRGRATRTKPDATQHRGSSPPKRKQTKAQPTKTADESGLGTLSREEISDLLEAMRIECDGPSKLNGKEPGVWIEASGWTPIEYLTAVYRNPFVGTQHRVAAAKSVLEYAHRKLPDTIEVDAKVQRSIDPTALAKLSDEELAALESLMEKLA